MGGSTTAAGAKLGRYQIVKHLASGGMAEVLLARATGIEGFTRHVVIKRIRPGQAKDQAFVQMFLNEARIAAQLHHANIVQVHDIGQEGNEYFFAMEYVHGEDLRRLLTHVARNRQKVPLEHVVTIICAAAVALHHAHEQRGEGRKPLGIVHRDVTPANILVGYDGNVKVVDFGIAKAAARTEETQAGTLKGKASYMSPEQCTGSKIDRRSDVFALGIVLYELVTARRLFKAENDFLTMSGIVAGKVPPARTHRPDVPDGLQAVITKALALKVEDRYQTADEMREALEQFAATAGLRTSTSALAAYMKQQFGERPEPWLLEDDDVDIEVVVDFDGSASAIVSPPDESLHQLAIPTSVEAMRSSPIVKARTRAITSEPAQPKAAAAASTSQPAQPKPIAAPPRKPLPLAPPGVSRKPLTAQIPILTTAPGSDKPKTFRIDTGPVPVPAPPRRKPKTVQIPITAQAAGIQSKESRDRAAASAPLPPSSGVPELHEDDGDSAVTTISEPSARATAAAHTAAAAPTLNAAIDEGWDTSPPPFATGPRTDVRGKAPSIAAGTNVRSDGASTAADANATPAPDTASTATGVSASSEPSAPTRAKRATKTKRTKSNTASAAAKPTTRAASEPKPATGSRPASEAKPATGSRPASEPSVVGPATRASSEPNLAARSTTRAASEPSSAARSTTRAASEPSSAAGSRAASEPRPTARAASEPKLPASTSRKTPPMAFAHLSGTAAAPLPSIKGGPPGSGPTRSASSGTATASRSGAIAASPSSGATPAANDAAARSSSGAIAAAGAAAVSSSGALPASSSGAIAAAGAAAASSSGALPASSSAIAAAGATAATSNEIAAASSPLPATSSGAVAAASGAAPTAIASAASAPGADAARAAPPAGARTTAGTWSLADLSARTHDTLDKNDVSAASKFDVASLSSSRTDASTLDTPIGAVGTPSTSFGAAEPAGDDDARDGLDSAPSLPPPPTTRKSNKLPGVAQLAGDDPDDPVIEPPRAAQPGSIAAKFAAPALPHGRAKTPSAMPEAWPGGSSAVKAPLLALVRSPRRIAIVAGALIVLVTIVVFATRGSDSRPSGAPAAERPTAPERANAGADERGPGITATGATASDEITGESATDESATREAAAGDPASGESATGDSATGDSASGDSASGDSATGESATDESVRDPAGATQASATNGRASAPTAAVTKPAVTKAAAQPPQPTSTKAAVTKAVKQPAKPTTKASTSTRAVTTAKPTKRPTARPAAKAKKPATKAPAKKPAWDPNSLFPKRK